MLYLLDIHHKPPMVVLVTEDEDKLVEVGQRYADQVQRPLIVATGPAPESAHFKPTIPGIEPALPAVPGNPALVAPSQPEEVKATVREVGH